MPIAVAAIPSFARELAIGLIARWRRREAPAIGAGRAIAVAALGDVSHVAAPLPDPIASAPHTHRAM